MSVSATPARRFLPAYAHGPNRDGGRRGRLAGPGGLTLAGTATYTAADGDTLRTTFDGPVQQTGPTSVSFEGSETVVGGTGRFAGATGTTRFAGEATTGPPRQPGSGWFTTEGTIAY
jgi:hypothetical protein